MAKQSIPGIFYVPADVAQPGCCINDSLAGKNNDDHLYFIRNYTYTTKIYMLYTCMSKTAKP